MLLQSLQRSDEALAYLSEENLKSYLELKKKRQNNGRNGNSKMYKAKDLNNTFVTL